MHRSDLSPVLPVEPSSSTDPGGEQASPSYLSAVTEVMELLTKMLERLSGIPTDETHPTDEAHLTVREFAHRTGRSENRVRGWIKSGKITAVKLDGCGPRSRWLIPRSELRRLLHTNGSAD